MTLTLPSAFARAARAGLFLLVACVLVAFGVVLATRLSVNAEIKATVEALASDGAGLAVEVGSVRGAWWSGLTLQDVTVHSSPELKSPVLARVPWVQVDYRLLAFLGQRPAPIRVDCYHPAVSLVVGRDHLANVLPRVRAPHEDGPATPAPLIELVFHAGHLSYTDNSVPKPFTAELANITGEGTLDGLALDVRLQALRDANAVRARVRYDLDHHRGQVDVKAAGLELPYWVNRFAFAPTFHATAGRADVEATLSWQDPLLIDELHLTGHATFRDGAVTLRDATAPVVDAHGRVDFDEHRATLVGVEARLDGMPLQIAGSVRDLVAPVPALAVPDPHLDLRVTVPHVRLGRLPTLLPALKDWRMGGSGELFAHVTGTALAPRASVRGLIPAGSLWEEPVTRGLVAFDYRTGALDFTRYRFELAGGQAEGGAWVGLPEDPLADAPYRYHVNARNLDVAALVRRHGGAKGLPFALSGRLAAELQAHGLGKHATTELGFRVIAGKLAGHPLHALAGHLSASTPHWRLPKLQLAWGANELVASAEGTDAGAFRARLALPHAELSELAALVARAPGLSLRGQVRAGADVAGTLGQPDGWRGRGAVTLASARLDRQDVSAARATWTLAHNRLVASDARVALLGGEVRLDGSLAPVIPSPGRATAGTFHVKAENLKPATLAYLPPAWRGVEGRFGAAWTLRLIGGAWQAAGDARASGLRHPEWGHLDDLHARWRLAGDQLHLEPLVWRQGRNRCSATGAVTLAADPRFDLRLHAQEADLASWIGAVAWAKWLARLDPTERGPARALGPLASMAELPKASRRAASGQDLLAGLERWTLHHKTPLARPHAAPPALTYWQGMRGTVGFDAHVSGSSSHPALALAAHFKGLQLLDRALDDGELGLTWRDRRLAISRCRLREGGRTVLTAGGVMGDRPSDALVVRTYGLDLGWCDRVLAPNKLRLKGRGDISVWAHGPWASPSVSTHVVLVAGQVLAKDLDPIAFERVEAQAEYEHGLLAISHATLAEGGHLATLSGAWPLTGGDAPVDLSLRLADGNLAIVNLFSQNKFRWLAGRGAIELKLAGTAFAPSLEGAVVLHDGRVWLQGLEQPIEHVEANVKLDDARVTIKRLSGRYGGGDVELAGRVAWDHFVPTRLDLTARAQPFRLAVPNDYYQGTVEADVRLRGPVDQPTLGGLLVLRDGTLRLKDQPKGPARAAALAGKQAPKLPRGLADVPLRLANLNLALGPNFRLKNPVVDLIASTRLGAPLALDGSLSAPRPRGVVLLESGTIRPLNNTFKIVEGRVEFMGEQVSSDDELATILATPAAEGAAAAGPPPTRLDIRAQTAAYDYQQEETVNIAARVTGSLEQMDMRFSAEPLRSEREILDILSKKQVLEGTFAGKLDRGQVIVKEVGGLVTSNLEDLISPYTLSLRNFLNLQTLRFELVTDYRKSSHASLAGFKPALVLETRPLWERLSLNSRLVAGDIYDATPLTHTESTYVALDMRLNKQLSWEYRLEPYIDASDARSLNHVLELKAHAAF